MYWQYRTILFEYQKDGLLGDRYIDDEEMEKTLNDQGSSGWELVAVTPVQEGLLAFFKRVPPRRPEARPVKRDAGIAEKDRAASVPSRAAMPAAAETQPPGPASADVDRHSDPPARKQPGVGEIKIS